MTLPPAISSQENLAAAEKPPELSAADKLEKRKVERREEKKKIADRKARKEIKRLDKEEAKKRKELAALEDAAAEARQLEEAAEAIRLEQEKREAKEAKEKRRIARIEAKAAEVAETKATMEAIAKEKEKKALEEKAQTDSSQEEEASDAESDTETEDEDGNSDTEDEMDHDGKSDTEDEMETDANAAEDDSTDDEDAKDRTYKDAATSGNDDDTVGADNNRWKSRRVRITIKIDVPKDKESRLINLQEKVNTILELGRRTEPNLFLRKFDETGSPYAEDKGSWIHKFSSTDLSANHFCDHLAHGLSNWIPLDRQSFYFRATLVAPDTCKFAKVLEEISHFIPENCRISNLLSQLIFDPVKLGNLLRSNEKMTSTEGFLNELNRRARQLNPDVVFGMSFSEMRRPNGERAKDWKKATRAVQLETNNCCMREATDIALRLFPGKRTKGHKPVWGMNLVFVYDIGHEDVDQLDTAQNNIDTLVSRQKMHMKYENRCSTNKIFPGALEDLVFSDVPDTFRDVLMNIRSSTTEGCEGGKIFSSIMFSDYKKKKEYWFCYHRKVKKEAEAIVRALPVMLKVELGLTIERLFYETAIDPSDQWNPVTRSLRNAITRATDNMLEGTDDLIGDDASEDAEVIEESENISLNTAESRERQRMMGENEDETVINQTKRKVAKATRTRQAAQQSIEVEEIEQNDDENSVSTLGDGTADFSSASKKKRFAREVLLETSHLVRESAKKADRRTADMQKTLEDERKRSDNLAQQLLQMQQLMAKAGLMGDDKVSTTGDSTMSRKSGSAQSNGQSSGQEEPNDARGTVASRPSTPTNTPGQGNEYNTPLHANTDNRYGPLASDNDDDSAALASGDDSVKTYDEDGNPVAYSYHTNADGTVTTRLVTTHKEGHQTSRIVHSDIESDGDDLSRDQSGSMTASVASASAMVKTGTKLIVEQATGGIPGKED